MWGGAILLALLQTYPYAFKLGSVGRLDSGDGQFSIWTVAWVARTLVVDPAHLFDANMFYPHRNTLAFSEANIGAGLLAAPVYWATKNPYAAHNSVLVLSFVLSAIGAYYLARRLTGSRGAAAVAGVLFACCPYIFARTAHIQLLMTAGLPFSMLALHRLVDRPTMGRAGALGGVLGAQGLSCGYYGFFAGMMVGLAVIYYAVTRRLWRRPGYWIPVGAAAVLSLAIVVPFLLPYLQLAAGGAFADRTVDLARDFSADWRAYLASPARSHEWLLRVIEHWPEVLFPGFLTLGFAGYGAWAASRRRLAAPSVNGPAGLTRETAGLYLLIAGLAAWTSVGPAGGLYTVLYTWMPVFTLVRAPARFGIVVALALAMLAAGGVAAVLRDRKRPGLIAAGLVAAAALELSAAPLRAEPVEAVSPVYRVLAQLPPGPVAEFPFYYERDMFHRHVYYLLNSTFHWKPLINGYGDHFPDDFRAMVVPVSSFPARAAFRLLKARDARYVVFHLRLYDSRSREKLLEQIDQYEPYLKAWWRHGDDWLFEIVEYPE